MNILTIIQTALSSIWRNKLTSFLAVLGVVIGVASVSTLISVGQGLKKDISSLIQGLGTNVVVVMSGKIDTTKTSSFQSSSQPNPADFMASDIITVKDVSTIRAMDNIQAVSPLSLVSGTVSLGDKVASPTLSGVDPSILDAMQIIKLDKGSMFARDTKERAIVLGYTPAQQLFGDADPIGQKVTLSKGGGEFKVVGTLADFKSTSVVVTDVNTLAFIPFDVATELNKGQVKISRLTVKAKDNVDIGDFKKQLKEKLLANHAGEENFTIFTQDDLLGLFDQFLNMATAMVSAIAAISIVVGGIGIMNIMLVTVTERTREIGIRKAVGATNSAILLQFLIESIVITLMGGILGLLVTLAATVVIRSQTSLKPDVTLNVLWLAIGISAVVGIVFGLIPALRASRKDPIEALRYE